jgi:hypothetical protein
LTFGTTPRGSDGIPLASVAVPGHAGGNLTALAGGPATVDSNGNETAPVAMYLASQLDRINDSITTYPFGHLPISISTATTTVVKSGAGVVRKIMVLGGTLGNVTIYDNTAASGTVIVPTFTPAVGQFLIEDIAFTTGLTILTAAATIIVGGFR